MFSYYGMALLSTGDVAAAAAAFRKELESNPNDFVSNLQLGALLKQDQRYDEAKTVFERALRIRPGDPGVRYQMATLDLVNGNIEQACSTLEQLIKEVPTSWKLTSRWRRSTTGSNARRTATASVPRS